MEQLFFFEVTYKNYLLGNKKEGTEVTIGFVLSNPKTDIFTINSGEHASEQRVSLRNLIPYRLSRVPHSNNMRTTHSEGILPPRIFSGRFFLEQEDTHMTSRSVNKVILFGFP